MRVKLALAVVLMVSLGFSGTAAAHVLLTDTRHEVGAILHVTPDDDPVAGQAGDIFFDVQAAGSSLAEAKLSITDSSDNITNVPLEIAGNTASARYTFPAQGVYHFTFSARVGGQIRVFEHAQRISRGQAAANQPANRQSWGEPLLIGAVIGLCALAILAFNRLRYTKEK